MIKKFVYIFLLTMLITCFLPYNCVQVSAKTPEYAQIKNSSTYIYRSAELDESISNKYCLIEETYFVKIVRNFNDLFYKVEYNGITGFVKKDEVMLINETPLFPYPSNVYFNINNTSSCYFRSAPKIRDTFNNTICTIAAGTKNIKYIGKIIGDEAIDFGGTIWYYAEYNGINGYVYASYTNSITTISHSSEQVTQFNGYDFSRINPLTNPMCVFIIVVTLIPFIFVLFLLYLPKAKIVRVTPKKTKPNKPEYYEENL